MGFPDAWCWARVHISSSALWWWTRSSCKSGLGRSRSGQTVDRAKDRSRDSGPEVGPEHVRFLRLLRLGCALPGRPEGLFRPKRTSQNGGAGRPSPAPLYSRRQMLFPVAGGAQTAGKVDVGSPSSTCLAPSAPPHPTLSPHQQAAAATRSNRAEHAAVSRGQGGGKGGGPVAAGRKARPCFPSSRDGFYRKSPEGITENNTNITVRCFGTGLQKLVQRKRQIDKHLATLECQIYNLEGSYLEETQHAGNIAQGFEAYLNPPRIIKHHKIPEEERIFSRSSTTYQRALELTRQEASEDVSQQQQQHHRQQSRQLEDPSAIQPAKRKKTSLVSRSAVAAAAAASPAVGTCVTLAADATSAQNHVTPKIRTKLKLPPVMARQVEEGTGGA
ncbi:MAG: histone acetyltransferase subunit NuA4-domain-containing protein [Olpidium bornovanus]|uniref:Chromatin modification-related protein EAF6 n=1 Tax=Olpidium bornovanus TaxID=278681 RepID=A0A8H8A1N2_9FUNG|nr:MAG: histone acetyltransferase subunit NuA4-domain-containing protein [Olpidium bornovanus]